VVVVEVAVVVARAVAKLQHPGPYNHGTNWR
jgi:hypothetical protein